MPDEKQSLVRCTAPWDGFEVHSGGRVLTCCWSQRPIGMLHREACTLDWFESVWNGPVIQSIRKQLLENRLDGICPAWCPRLLKGGRVDEQADEIGKTAAFRENQDLLASEMREGKLKLRARPQYIVFIPTKRCNLHCVACPQDHQTPDHRYQDFNRIVLPTLMPGARLLTAMGGEPLMSRDFRELVKAFEPELYPDCKFSMVTNGILLDRSILALMPGRFGPVGVSIDGATPSTYEQIRLGGKWEKVIANLRALVALQPPLPSITLMFTIMHTNFRELPQMVDLAYELGVGLSIHPVLGDWHAEHLFTEAERLELLDILNALPQRHPTVAVNQLDGALAFYSRTWMEQWLETQRTKRLWTKKVRPESGPANA